MQKITEKNSLKMNKEPIVVFPLKKWEKIEKTLKEYERKEKLLKSLERFENLTKWGRDFAKRKNITPQQVLEDD